VISIRHTALEAEIRVRTEQADHMESRDPSAAATATKFKEADRANRASAIRPPAKTDLQRNNIGYGSFAGCSR